MIDDKKVSALAMSILRATLEETLREIMGEVVTGKSKMTREDYNEFAEIVRQALDETENEYFGGGTDNSECENCAFRDKFRDKCGSPQNIDLALNARLVLMADEAAKEEGKTLSQWLTNLIAKELFY